VELTTIAKPYANAVFEIAEQNKSHSDWRGVLEAGADKVALVVDDLLGQQQVVIKSMESNYKKVEGVSGATILGDGTVSLILDITDMVRMAGAYHKSSKVVSINGQHKAA